MTDKIALPGQQGSAAPNTETDACVEVQEVDEGPDNRSKQKWAFSVPEAGEKIGLGRSASYGAARRGEIPTVKIGNRQFVPIAIFKRMFGVED